jgi:glucose uptake protein
MFIIENYSTAVIFCFITMLCWGSWANTQKLTAGNWRFELFYWDYVIGIVLFTLLFGVTLGSWGNSGRPFMVDIQQGSPSNLQSAFIGGIIFNAANILLTAAIAVAGMSVAFPVGIGLALVIGVIVNYLDAPVGNSSVLFIGVACIAIAIGLNAYAFQKKAQSSQKASVRGLILSIISGSMMGLFYKYVANAMSPDFANPEIGKLTPYSALFIFSLGILASNFIFNSLLMQFPVSGEKVSISAYFKGNIQNHFVGILGGCIWSIGMSFSILASEKAGPAISYGLGQGATVVAAIWGIYVWKEFKGAPLSVNKTLGIMLLFYVIGLAAIIFSR